MWSWLWSLAPDPLTCANYPYVIETEFGVLGGNTLSVGPEATELSGGICLEAGGIQIRGEALLYHPQDRTLSTEEIQGTLDGWSFTAQSTVGQIQKIQFRDIQLTRGEVQIQAEQATYGDGILLAQAISGKVRTISFRGDHGILEEGVFQMEDALATPCYCGEQIQAVGERAGYDLASGAINLKSLQIKAYGIPLFRLAEFTVDPESTPAWQFPIEIGYDEGIYLSISIPPGVIPGQNGGTLPWQFEGELSGFPNNLMTEATVGYQLLNSPLEFTPLLKAGLGSHHQLIALGGHLTRPWQDQPGIWSFKVNPELMGLLYLDGQGFAQLGLDVQAHRETGNGGIEIGLELDRITGDPRFPSDLDQTTGNQMYLQWQSSPWTARTVVRLEDSELVREELIAAYAHPIPAPAPETPPHLSLAPLIGYDLRRAGISRAGAVIRYADCCLIYRLGIQAVFLPQPGDRVDGGFTLGIELR